jgi:hypothetical protein
MIDISEPLRDGALVRVESPRIRMLVVDQDLRTAWSRPVQSPADVTAVVRGRRAA